MHASCIHLVEGDACCIYLMWWLKSGDEVCVFHILSIFQKSFDLIGIDASSMGEEEVGVAESQSIGSCREVAEKRRVEKEKMGRDARATERAAR